MFVVQALITEVTVEVNNGVEAVMDLGTEDGSIGMLPVFKDYDSARAYAATVDGHPMIREVFIETKESDNG